MNTPANNTTNNNARNCRIVFEIVIILLALWSLLSLPFSPTAWFDEVYMADFTHNLITSGQLINTLDSQPNNHCIYGPVYFLLTGLSTWLFGFGIFQFRIINLLAFFSCLYFLYKILRLYEVEPRWIFLICVVYALDPLNFQNSHSGRMDFVALAFVMSAYFVYLKFENQCSWTKTVLTSFLLTLSILTTPRVAAIAIPIALMQFVETIKHKKFLMTVLYAAIPLLLYVIWIFIDYGSFDSFIEQFFSNNHTNDSNSKSSLVGRFVGGNFVLAKYHYIPAMASAVFFVISLYTKKFKPIILYSAPLLFYYLLVNDTGMYGVFVIPFFCISIGFLLHFVNSYWQKYLLFASVFIVLFINLGIYSIKTICVLSSLDERNEFAYEKWYACNIPANSVVFACYESYYAAVNNNSTFIRNIRENYSLDEVVSDVKQHGVPDYIIVTDDQTEYNKALISLFDAYKIAEYTPQKSNLNKLIYGFLRVNVTDSYSCTIYKINSSNK